MSALAKTLLVIAIIGALNWGLIGFFNFNLVDAIFHAPVIARVVYAIVGVCGVVALLMLPTLHGRGNISHQRPA